VSVRLPRAFPLALAPGTVEVTSGPTGGAAGVDGV